MTSPFVMGAMAQIVLAAHAGDSRIGVRIAAGGDAIPQVTELESHPKMGKGD